ncbi:MAG TPA: YkvA family protein [candidate division Zixibacteria bacterium]|nr:YkvA family protein [candidate division Zixibacteria bacterium]
MPDFATPAEAGPAGPGFPRERATALVRRLPGYARLAWALSRDPKLTPWRRAAVLAAAAYLASPIDLVPGIIPVVGQLDDAAVALLGLRYGLRGLPAAERAALLARTGITAADLDEDLRTVRHTAAWLARRGGRLGWRASRGLARLGARGVRSAVQAAVHAAGSRARG